MESTNHSAYLNDVMFEYGEELVGAHNKKIRIRGYKNIKIYYRNRASILSELIAMFMLCCLCPIAVVFKKLCTNLCNNVVKTMPEIDTSELYFEYGYDFEHFFNFNSDDDEISE